MDKATSDLLAAAQQMWCKIAEYGHPEDVRRWQSAIERMEKEGRLDALQKEHQIELDPFERKIAMTYILGDETARTNYYTAWGWFPVVGAKMVAAKPARLCIDKLEALGLLPPVPATKQRASRAKVSISEPQSGKMAKNCQDCGASGRNANFIHTCSHTEANITLCPSCYKKRGNSVR